MRNSLPFLVLFLTSIFGVSLLCPPEDIPETPYDKSESVLFEDTPVFSILAPTNYTTTSPAHLRLPPITAAIGRERASAGERPYRPMFQYEPAFLCALLC